MKGRVVTCLVLAGIACVVAVIGVAGSVALQAGSSSPVVFSILAFFGSVSSFLFAVGAVFFAITGRVER